MTITDRTTAARRDPMTPLRKTALVAGVFYLITFISIPTLIPYGNLKTDRNFITSAGSSNAVLWGVLLEVIVALAGIGTTVTLFPVVKRQNEAMALGFVAVRTLEAAMIFTGVLSLLSLVHLRQDLGATAAADPASLLSTGASLVAPTTGPSCSDKPSVAARLRQAAREYDQRGRIRRLGWRGRPPASVAAATRVEMVADAHSSESSIWMA
jgi:hypothetical protein